MEQRLIDGLLMGVSVRRYVSSHALTPVRLRGPRSTIVYNPSYVTANPHLFITNEWIDAVQLRDFLDRAKSFDPISSSQPLTSPPTRVKVEHDVPDASATALSTAGRAARHCRREHSCGANPNSTGRRARSVRNPGLRIRLRLGGLGNTGYVRQREAGTKDHR